MNAMARGLSIAVSAIALAIVPSVGAAQSYPTKAVTIVIPFPPGGGADIQARILSKYLSQDWRQPVIVESKPGGGTTIGAAYAAKAAPDGYTLYLASTSFSILPSIYKNLSFHPVRSFSPVIQFVRSPFILTVHPSVKASSVKELLELAKANPGKLNYASTGSGAGPHLSAEMLRSLTGINAVHVPYQGTGPAMVAILAGQVDFMFAESAAVQHYKSGKLRPLGVSTPTRFSLLPDIPTIAEEGVKGFNTSNWSLILAPGGTPRDVISTINTSIAKAVQAAEVRQVFASQGYETTTSSPEEATSFLISEVNKYERLVPQSGAKVD